MKENPAFLAPPVGMDPFKILCDKFHDAVLAALPGGIHLTAAKNAARAALLDALRKR